MYRPCRVTMLAAPLVAPLVALLVLACVRADLPNGDDVLTVFLRNDRNSRALETEVAGCLYDGRWFVEGAGVRARDACLRCACARGALTCARRACAPAPDPPPPRCHLRHRRGACCPELHCPDGVTVLEQAATARLDTDDYSDIAKPTSTSHACVEGGTVYAAGSAMSSRTACEQCFCLRGARRCVRPRCLPAPPACAPRPAAGACCPQRYYCERVTTLPPHLPHPHDCEVDGRWISEGERVPSAEKGADCTQCFCLQGAVRCQPLACAPPLHGCRPLLRTGQCCPHQYICDHLKHGVATQPLPYILDNALISTRKDDRSFHTSKSSKQETTTKTLSPSISTTKNAPIEAATKKQPASTAKVKRKTNDSPPPTTTSHKPTENIKTTTSHKPTENIKTTTSHKPTENIKTTTSHKPTENIKTTTTSTQTPTTTTSTTVTTVTELTTINETTTEEISEHTSTEQPEGSVKIMINGTINCTAELSTSLPLNSTTNDNENVKVEAEPRIPYVSGSVIDAHTLNSNDIITEGYANGNFDENESFTINVTSSLRANTSHTTSAPVLTSSSKAVEPTHLTEKLNISKKTKEDYDYDYAEPTLPPSLPNLKIIPFVAADAVVDDDDVASKTSLTYPVLEREDKFPVYYPSVEPKVTAFANRREDTYNPTQYPVFISNKVESVQYPSLTREVDMTNTAYPSSNKDVATLHDYTVPTSIGSQVNEVKNKIATKPPSTSSTFDIKTPSVNLFSPPVETEGGFIPKGPGIIDEYYAVYPSTPSGPSVPHLTTSMQLDIGKEGECVSGDGRRVPEGDSISLACSVCTCAWGELHCSPRPCPTPPGCTRRPASSSAVDLCCGELICDQDTKTTEGPGLPSRKTEITLNETKVPIEIETIPFDPPPDRSVPVSNNIAPDNLHKDITIKSDVEDTLQKQVGNNTSPASNKTLTTPVTTYSTVTSSSTEKMTTAPVTTTTTSSERNETNDKNQSQEYDDEEEDEGFSFGSVLKLLLSESYDTTTASPYKKKPEAVPPRTTVMTTTPMPISTTRRLLPKLTMPPFVPLPHHQYVPPKKVLQQNTVNRIDHLVLGEATAIKKSTPRPTNPFRITESFKPAITRPTTSKPIDTTRLEVTRKEELSVPYTSVSQEAPRPSPGTGGLPGVGGLLKLAGCNIYGRMYRVGRIIAELSTACQECRCTELGVQCRDLRC